MQEAANDVLGYVQSITDHLRAAAPEIEQVLVEAPDLVNLQPLEGCMSSHTHHLRPVPTHAIHRDLISVDYEDSTCEPMDDFIEAAGTARPIDLGWRYPHGGALWGRRRRCRR